MHNSEESAHVRFASKVEFSPTPPRSNESLPQKKLPEQMPQSKSSSRHTSEGGGGQRKKSALRNQIDGGASEPPESAEDLISIYEANRFLRGRSIEKRGDVEYVSETFPRSGKSSALSSPEAEMGATAASSNSHPHPSSRHAVFEREEAPPSEIEERRWRSSRGEDTARRRLAPSTGGGDTETATQLSREKRLARALSESPSRENMRLRAQRQQEHERGQGWNSAGEVGRGRSDWRAREEEEHDDGKGPYREEARTESMDALYGSGSGAGRPRERMREFVGRERC